MQQMLEEITELSHFFGTDEFVKGGGGNTSAKSNETLWVKPSGTTLSGLSPEKFISMDRKRLSRLYDVETPEDKDEREALVKKMMADSISEGVEGRASVEAPLHNSFSARYVVHTHPALVNGMTCAVDGARRCQELFPEALWVEYVDPGYTLCIYVNKEIADYTAKHGKEPSVIFLKNHGVFVAGDTVDEIRSSYKAIFDTLTSVYADAGVGTNLTTGEMGVEINNVAKELLAMYKELTGLDFSVVTSPALKAPGGPLTPDHIVYMKAYVLENKPNLGNLKEFQQQRGYLPKIISTDMGIIAIDETEKGAKLANILNGDAALVQHLSQAFGGVEFMSQAATDFIENWEVESYRKKQI